MAGQSEVEWPTCEQAGCAGIRLASARMCLAHASEEETAAALKLISETGAIDARGVPITGALLERILTAAPRGENEEPLLKDCRFDRVTFTGDAGFDRVTFTGDAGFDRVTFTGDAGFDRVTFTGDAGFDRATFTGDAGFDRATFTGDAGFDRVTFKQRAGFGGATFTGAAWFGGATFTGDAGFGGATFTGAAWFRGATFTGDAEFYRATFTGAAEFDRPTFTGDARFGGATFKQRAWFSGATFTGAAVFRGATFTGAAWFYEVTFTGDAGFGGATFTGAAWFYGATFTGAAWFSRATFTGDARFREATFTGHAWFYEATFKRAAEFDGVRFEQARQFGPLLAYRGLVLDDVQFAQPVQIEVSSTGVCCRRARFPGGAQFRLRWARVVLDDAELAGPSILAGIPRLSSEALARREARIARAWRRLLAGEISERPQLVSVRRANVAGLGLSNVSVADCRFAGAHNLDKLRLESDVSFATAPSPVDPSGRRWEGREVIAEERTWRANRARWSRRHWAAPKWPGWLGDQPGRLDPGQIAGLYRALRKGREDTKDEPGAADFYYGEMEMRRLGRRPVNPIDAGSTGAASRGRVERWILTAYWLVSGYGLRAWRAVAGLAVVTALFAVAFHFVGFAVPPHPVSYWTSLLYAFRATLSLTDDQVKLTAWGQLLQGVLRLTGPVLLGLALLALRGRVKR